MSEKYEIVKSYFDRELWSKERVHTAVGKWITANEYKTITGEDYV